MLMLQAYRDGLRSEKTLKQYLAQRILIFTIAFVVGCIWQLVTG